MIGLPFPNSNTPEWRAKLEHVEKVARDSYHSGSSTDTSELAARNAFAKTAGREFYENACMRAVNQSIGRAIRHREDYAVIALFDRRYLSDRIASKLPKWIQNGLVRDRAGKPFGEVMGMTGRFFKTKGALKLGV
jgi:chromosome transmission fidelity protein 1